MRIGICCYPTYGGSGAIATELGQSLARAGHEVHFLSYARPARLSEFQPGITFHRVQVASYPLFRYPPYDLALASLMREVAETHELDVLHVHYAIPHAVSALLALQMLEDSRLRLVTTLHGTDITIVGAERAYFHPTRFGIERSDCVTAVSEWLRSETVRVFGPSRRIHVVPNFVDTSRFAPCEQGGCRSKLVPSSARVLCHVSNFRPVKRVHDVVDIFAGVTRSLDAHLLLVGDGPDRLPAEHRVRQLGIEDRVHFLGEQDGIERILQASDLFLLPSEHESFGLAALEAMACGVPVVGSRSGGLPEVVSDGDNGVLVDVGDVDCAVDAAVEILRSDDLRVRMGRLARATAVETFAEDRVVGMYRTLYEDVLSADR